MVVVTSLRCLNCYFIIAWQHVLSCMNNAVDLSSWFQLRCSSLFVPQAMSSLFQHAWISLHVKDYMFKPASSAMFKLACSTMFKLTKLNYIQALARSTMFKPVWKQSIHKIVLLNRIQESAQPDEVGLTTYLGDKTWAADVYLIYKLEPKTSVCISDKDRMRMFYLA